MFITILKLFAVTLIPIAFATGIHLLKIYTKFEQLSKHLQYAIIIALFSISCILGTVFGVESSAGALINVRDASPIIAGLMFGGPVGVVVGFIGGLYRFVSVYWGGSGAYTQIACSVSTFMAGVFTLLVRRFIFDNHHGKWYYGFFLGVLCEDFHMLLVILTHISDIEAAYGVVTDVVGPMVLVNSLAVMIAILIADFLYKEKIFDGGKPFKISTKIQLTLMCGLTGAYCIVSSISYFATKNVEETSNNALLTSNVSDLINNVDSLVDEELLTVCKQLKQKVQYVINDTDSEVNAALLSGLYGADYELTEAHLVDNNNVIQYTTKANVLGFNMSSTDQSKEFGCLINEKDYFSQSLMKPGSDNVAEDNMKYVGIRLDANNKNISYLQIGLNETKYHALLDKKVKSSASFRHIGKKGYLIVARADGTVVSINEGVETKKEDVSKLIKELDKTDFSKEKVKVVETTAKYVSESGSDFALYPYYTHAQYVEGYYVIALANQTECDMSTNISFTTITLTEVFAFLVLYCVLFIVIKRSVVDKIEEVGSTLSKITKGNLNVKVHVNNSKELKELSKDINATVTSLKKFAEQEQKKIAEELQFAKNIQHSALPTVFPLNNNFRIFANMITAKAVGGDFYDFYYLNQNHVAILIADVSGKGIPAAMFMMKSKTIIKGLVESGMPIHLAATEANKKLCEGNDANMFVTGWLGVINIKTGHVDYVNAGHNPPLIQKEDGTFEYLKGKKGFVFAGLEGFEYEKQSFEMKPGEKIYLYTDGVTEATNKEKELFGESRLLESCNNYGKLIPKDMCAGIMDDVNKFVKGAEQADDITMLCFQLTDQEKENSHVFEAKVENVPSVTEYVGKYLQEAGCSMKAEMQINVAIDEIFSNICRYAYKGNQEGNARVSVTFDPSKKNVSIAFEDRGVPYNPLEKEDPNVEASVEEREIGGLGIFIVKNTMDDVVYENDNGHNILTITKNIK